MWLISIVLFATFLMVFFYSGTNYGFDDSVYAQLARSILANGYYNPLSTPYGISYAFPYFAAISAFVFGTSNLGFVILVSAIEYLSLIILTYILSLRVISKNEGVALASAFVCATLPFVLEYSTRLLNDTLMGVVATLALIFLLSDSRRDLFLAGIMAGALIFLKFDGLIFIAIFIVIAMAKRKVEPILAVALMAGLFIIPYLIMGLPPLYPLTSYLTAQATIGQATTGFKFVALGVMLGFPVIINAFDTYTLGLLLWLGMVSTIIGIWSKDKNILLLATIFWAFFLIFNFGSSEVFVSRYLDIVAAPFSILVAYAFYKVWGLRQWNKLDALVPLILFVLITGTFLSLLPAYATIYNYNAQIKACGDVTIFDACVLTSNR